MDAVDFSTPRWTYEDETARLEFLQFCILAGYVKSRETSGGQTFNVAFHRDCVNQYMLMELHAEPTSVAMTKFCRAFERLESISDVHKVINDVPKKDLDSIRDFLTSGKYYRAMKRYEKRKAQND